MNNVVFFIIILNMLFLLFYCCSMLLSLSLVQSRTVGVGFSVNCCCLLVWNDVEQCLRAPSSSSQKLHKYAKR